MSWQLKWKSEYWKPLAIILGVAVLLLLVIGLCLDGFRKLCERFYTSAVAAESAVEAQPPRIDALLASSPDVQVAPGAQQSSRAFQLYAWHRNSDGEIVAGRFNPASWSLRPVSANAAANGLVTISAFPGDAYSEADVAATDPDYPDLSANIKLRLWAGSPAAADFEGGSDVVEAAHASRAVPTVALLEQKVADDCAWSRGIPFVGAAAVGEQSQGPCSLALFSGRHAMLFQGPASIGTSWAAPKATVAFDLKDPVKLPVAVFVAVTARTASVLSGTGLDAAQLLPQNVAAAAAAQAKVDIDWVNMIFEANRVGLVIKDPEITILDPANAELPRLVGASPANCAAPRLLAANDATSSWYAPKKISVYYVDWLDYPSDPLHAGSRGGQCNAWSNGNGPVIYISYTRHSTTSLAHEIGHALSLGHVEDPFGTFNLMNGNISDGPLNANARSHLTLGQVFRMNASDESWLNPIVRSGDVAACWTADRGVCPALELDLVQ